MKGKKKSVGTIILYIAYAFIVILLLVMAIARFSSLCAKEDFRKNLSVFPNSCSSWSVDNGCTYVSLYSSQCTRAESIPQTFVNSFINVTPATLNQKINTCIDKHAAAKLQSPKSLSSQTNYQGLIHVTWTSALLGVIDDMYIETTPNADLSPDLIVVNIFSQLRVGKNDFSENYDHVQTMLNCLDKQLPSNFSAFQPCSQP